MMRITILIIKMIWMWKINKEVHEPFPNIWRKQGEQSKCREENWINRNVIRVCTLYTLYSGSLDSKPADCRGQWACMEDLLGRLHSHPQFKAEGSTSSFPDEPHFPMALYMHFNLFTDSVQSWILKEKKVSGCLLPTPSSSSSSSCFLGSCSSST